MALEAWVDENSKLYVAGRNPEDDALLDDGNEVIKTVNWTLDQFNYDGIEVTADTLTDFRTIWVDPEVYEEEEWPRLAWTEDPKVGREAAWKPVMTIDIEEI